MNKIQLPEPTDRNKFPHYKNLFLNCKNWENKKIHIAYSALDKKTNLLFPKEIDGMLRTATEKSVYGSVVFLFEPEYMINSCGLKWETKDSVHKSDCLVEVFSNLKGSLKITETNCFGLRGTEYSLKINEIYFFDSES